LYWRWSIRACPAEGISLWLGTEKRGVDLPKLNTDFETNVAGVYVAGELGGMGLISNAVRQGELAVESIAAAIHDKNQTHYDLVIVGSGPAGISASLKAKELNLKVITLEQENVGGTVLTYPRSKIVMTSPMNLPLYGKVKFHETTKMHLIDLWNKVLSVNKVDIKEHATVKNIRKEEHVFITETAEGEQFVSQKVLLAIGRGGTPTKLNVPGEYSEKVAYRLLDAEEIQGKKILVVGGGGSAVESALLLMDKNSVTMSYRGDVFRRSTLSNLTKMKEAIANGKIDVKFETQVVAIESKVIKYKYLSSDEVLEIENDFVYIFVGGVFPSNFLREIGIELTTTHGTMMMNSENAD